MLFGAAVIGPHLFPTTLRVPEDHSTIQRAIAAAPAGALIRVGPGTFHETLVITKPLVLVGSANGGTRVEAAGAEAVVAIRDTRAVRLEGLTIVGGEYGILVDEAEAVQILGNRVLSSRFVGIRLSRAAARIEGNEVRAGFGPYGMGIELANTHSRPESVISRNVVAGATQEGIVLHNAHARIENNTVTANGLRGVSITEMSMATVARNTITDNADAGIYVVDWSMAEIDGNHIASVRPGPEGKAEGIRAFFYAEVMLGRNRIDVPADRAVVASFGASVEDLLAR